MPHSRPTTGTAASSCRELLSPPPSKSLSSAAPSHPLPHVPILRALVIIFSTSLDLAHGGLPHRFPITQDSISCHVVQGTRERGRCFTVVAVGKRARQRSRKQKEAQACADRRDLAPNGRKTTQTAGRSPPSSIFPNSIVCPPRYSVHLPIFPHPHPLVADTRILPSTSAITTVSERVPPRRIELAGNYTGCRGAIALAVGSTARPARARCRSNCGPKCDMARRPSPRCPNGGLGGP